MSKLYVDELHPKTTGGQVTIPNKIAFKAHGNNAAYVDTSPVPFPSVQFNYGGGYNSSTYEFTVPVAGLYQFGVFLGILRLIGVSQAAYPLLLISRPSVGTLFSQYFYSQSAGGDLYIGSHITTIHPCEVGDTAKVTFNKSGNGSYYNDNSESSFYGYLIG